MLKSFRDIEEEVKKLRKRRVVVPAAGNTCILEAALEARERDLADFTLIDSKERLFATLSELNFSKSRLQNFEIVEEEDCNEAARMAVSMVREGKADLLAKGRLQTFELMKAVLDKAQGLREESSLLCDIMVIEKPLSPDAKLIGMSDPALCVAPTASDLVKVSKNCLPVMKRFGYEVIRCAFLAALEVEKESMPATVRAAEAARELRESEEGVEAQGPLSFDIACSPRAAAVKKLSTPVAGQADLLIVPNIETGNVLAKTIAVFTNAQYGHLVLGAQVPVVMSSRSDSSLSKFNSILLGLLSA